MARPLLLDVDTGVDDAIAIALATRLEVHNLIGVTTVAGNVPIEFATDNTLKVLAWLDVDVPVYRGASEPLVRPLHTARQHHGFDGLGGWAVPVAAGDVEDMSAPEAIIRLTREHRGEITLVFVGPLTNLAIALNLEPRLSEWVDRLVIMGGAFWERGNETPDAEFNIFVDPEAAAVVARSGMNQTWVGLDVTRQTTFDAAHWPALEDADDHGRVLVREVTRRSLTELGRPSFPLHDPLAVAIAERPDIAQYESGVVVVNTDEHSRGRTRIAATHGNDARSRTASVVDQSAFDRIFGTLAERR